MKNIEFKKLYDKNITTIFFDIFDTIVYRTVQPEYTKKIWANHLIKRFDLSLNMQSVYQKRNKLELKLGEKSAASGFDWEFTYDSLLEEMYDMFQQNTSKKEFKEVATQIEIEIESSVQKPDEKIIKEIKQLKEAGKKIYCVSDMYLSKEMLKQIFSNLGILELFDDIYVSCEYLKSKRSGNLYDIVLKELNIKPQNCVMIGDNKTSDYDNAISKKMTAIHLDRSENYKKYEEFLNKYNEKEIMNTFKELAKTPSDSFEHIAFTLYKFTDKLYHYLRKNDYNEVFFLSREGEFLKKLFDEYQKNINGKTIDTYYILVSRKSTYLPSLKKLEDETFGGILKQYMKTSVSELLGSLNLSKEDRDEILESYRKDCEKSLKKYEFNKTEKEAINAIINKDYNYRIVNLYRTKLLKILKENKVFKRIYEENRKNQNTLFKKYIKQHSDSKRICVVDIGWNGSIQDNIQNALGDEYEVNGCLYGFVNRLEKPIENKVGLIYTNYPNKTKNYSLFIENRTMFEILLGASHGSATRYVENNGKVEVTTFEKEEEKELYDNVVSKIQDRIFKINQQLNQILSNGYYDNLKIDKLINNLHYEMVFNPTMSQRTFFNEIYHYENFGVFEFSKFNLQKKMTLKYYIKENIKFFIKYNSFFYDTYWPTLKLINEKLYIPRFIYKSGKKFNMKRRGVL